MPLFAQLADAFDNSTWIIIFAVGFGSPLFGALMRAGIQGSLRGRYWRPVAVYYGLTLSVVAVLCLGIHWIILVIAFYLLLLAGPVVGLTLLAGSRLKE
jgi:hypothetical protein